MNHVKCKITNANLIKITLQCVIHGKPKIMLGTISVQVDNVFTMLHLILDQSTLPK